MRRPHSADRRGREIVRIRAGDRKTGMRSATLDDRIVSVQRINTTIRRGVAELESRSDLTGR